LKSASVTSSTYEHRYGKRRYHGVTNNPYPLPNDEDEKERLDELHQCYRTLFGGNVVTPIRRKPTQIVDVGTGSGQWVIEVGEQFPTAQVFGTDLSPIQPTLVPLNVEFVIMDLTDGLDFDDGSTDLVQSRVVHAGVKDVQWPAYLKEIFRILKPNYGWTQMMETAYPHCFSNNKSLPKDAPLSKFFQYVHQQFRVEQGIMMHGEKLEQLVIDAGFTDVQVRQIKIELGDWGPDPAKHEIGRLCRKVWSVGLSDLAESLTRFIPNDEERSDFAEGVKADILNSDYNLYCLLYLITARKPGVKLRREK